MGALPLFMIYAEGIQMNKSFPVALAMMISGAAWAAEADYVDTARVVSSKPVYERVSEPKQECWTETVTSNATITKSAPVEERSIGGALLGGVIGGVIGSQIGQGNGNTVATGAGAIAGAIIGDRVANKDAQKPAEATTQQVPQTREERRCRQVESSREVLRGYDVTYRYGGRDTTVRMSRQPGDTVRVGVSVLGEAGASDSSRSTRDMHETRGEDNREYDNRDRGYDNREYDSRDRNSGNW
jgi:uncharacterized protein YcfJ